MEGEVRGSACGGALVPFLFGEFGVLVLFPVLRQSVCLVEVQHSRPVFFPQVLVQLVF